MKTCSRCGKERPDEEFLLGRVRCVKCREVSRIEKKAYKVRHPEKRKEQQKRYRTRHPEKVAKNRKSYYLNRKAQGLVRKSDKELCKRIQKRNIETLSDGYIASLLVDDRKIPLKFVYQYPLLIEAKRAQLQLLRAARQQKQ